MEETSRDSYIKNCEMTKPSQDTISQIVDEILSEMPLEEKGFPCKYEKERR